MSKSIRYTMIAAIAICISAMLVVIVLQNRDYETLIEQHNSLQDSYTQVAAENDELRTKNDQLEKALQTTINADINVDINELLEQLPSLDG